MLVDDEVVLGDDAGAAEAGGVTLATWVLEPSSPQPGKAVHKKPSTSHCIHERAIFDMKWPRERVARGARRMPVDAAGTM